MIVRQAMVSMSDLEILVHTCELREEDEEGTKGGPSSEASISGSPGSDSLVKRST